VGSRCNRHEGKGLDFCGCAETPNTLWEKEVLLIANMFEIPPFEAGYSYRILMGGSSHVGYGDATHIYVNGEKFFQRDKPTPRRRGAEAIGERITTERWEHFASGRVHIAAKSFLPQHRGNSLTVFLRRMQLPPLQEELYRGLQLVGLRDVEWQASQDPDSDIDPTEGLYIWDGQVRRNADAVGTWKVVDEVAEIADFDPDSTQRPGRGWNPRLQEIELEHALATNDPMLVWTGSRLLDANSKEALLVEHAQVRGKDYLFIQAGGFSPDHPAEWTSPWLVFEQQ
jgi:hypothetical protein